MAEQNKIEELAYWGDYVRMSREREDEPGLRSVPDQIRSQAQASVVEVHTNCGVARLTREQADKVLDGGELWFDVCEGWRVR